MIGPNAATDPADEFARRIAAMDARIADLERAAQRRVTPKVLTFFDALDNGTATSYQSFASHAGLATVTVPTRMIVTVVGWWGFATADNGAHLQIWDELGANRTEVAGSELYNDHRAGKWQTLACLGFKDYAAGESPGFKLAYSVTAANLYIRTGAKVELIPL